VQINSKTKNSRGVSITKMLIHAHFVSAAILTYKVGQSDLVLVYDEGSLAAHARL